MAGQVQPKQLTFQLQLLGHSESRDIRITDFPVRRLNQVVEQLNLQLIALLAPFGCSIHCLVKHCEQLRPMPGQTVESTRLKQRFNHTLVADAQINTPAEIEQTVERPLLADGHNVLHRQCADILHRSKPKADMPAPFTGNRGEQHAALVDIRRQYTDACAAAVQHIFRHLAVGAHHSRQHRCHKLHRIMRLQISCLEGQHTIGGGMGPREAVIGESDNHIINGVRIRLLVTLLQAALHEVAALLVQCLAFLLRHRPAQQICFTEREAGHQGGDLHNLLLVHDNPVGIRQDRRQISMRIFYSDFAVLAGDKLRNEFHRTRTVKRQYGYDVLEA